MINLTFDVHTRIKHTSMPREALQTGTLLYSLPYGVCTSSECLAHGRSRQFEIEVLSPTPPLFFQSLWYFFLVTSSFIVWENMLVFICLCVFACAYIHVYECLWSVYAYIFHPFGNCAYSNTICGQQWQSGTKVRVPGARLSKAGTCFCWGMREQMF